LNDSNDDYKTDKQQSSASVHFTMVDTHLYSMVFKTKQQVACMQWCPVEIELSPDHKHVLGMSHVEHVDQRVHNGVYQSLMHVFEAVVHCM
jgi:ribonucleotide reductase beta subunit family protein with ferritin-like domain